MSEITTEKLEAVHLEYEARRANEEKVTIAQMEEEYKIPTGKLKNWRANRVRLKETILNPVAANPASQSSPELVKPWPLERIKMRGNSRTEFDLAELQGLANSIRSTGGELQFVVGYEEDGWCVLIIGERRLRANELRRDRGEEVNEMLVRMIPKPTAKDFMLMNLVENTQRVNLKPSEEAKWMLDMLELTDDESGQQIFTADSLAEETGKRPEYVSRALTVLNAPKKARDKMDQGEVGFEVVGMIGALPEAMREKASEEIIFGLGGVMSQKEARSFMAQNYRRDLRKADFDKTAEDLLPTAPACAACPWLGKKHGLQGQAGEYTCLNPSCFHEKQMAEAAREKARLIAEGESVDFLTDEQAGKVFDGLMGRVSPTSGFIDLDAKPDPHFLNEADRSSANLPKWRQALESQSPPRAVAWDERGHKHELVEVGPAMAAALSSPYGSIFRVEAANGLLTAEEEASAKRIKAAGDREATQTAVEGGRALLSALGDSRFDWNRIHRMIDLATERGFKADDFVFLCEMLDPEMAKADMTPRGFLELLKSKALDEDGLLAVLLMVLQVRALRYTGFDPWCEDGPMAEICNEVDFKPAEWRKRWKNRKAAAQRRAQAEIAKEAEKEAEEQSTAKAA